MKTWSRLGLLFLVIALCLTAPMTGLAEAGAEVTWWCINFGDPTTEVYREACEAWNAAHPELQVNFEIVQAGVYYERLAAAFASNDGPDIYNCSAAMYLKYVQSGVALCLDDWIIPRAEDYYENCIEGVTVDGHIYAFPGNGDLLGLYVNLDLFESAGVTLPETWDDCMNAANAIASDEVYGMLLSLDSSGGYMQFEHYPYLWMCGGDVLQSDNKTSMINSQSAIDAFGFYRDMANSTGGSLDTNGGADMTLFAEGLVGMQVSGSWGVATMANYPDLNYTVLKLPVPVTGMESVSIEGGWHYMVNAKSRYANEAAKFLNWLFNSDETEYLERACEAYTWFAPRKSILSNAKMYKQFPLNLFATEIAPIARMEPTYNSEVVSAYGDAIEEAIYDKDKPLKDIVAELDAKIVKAMNP